MLSLGVATGGPSGQRRCLGLLCGARVSIGQLDNGGFGLAVELEITLPNLEHDAAQQLADKAHQVCPYSNATRGNIDVALTVA